MQETCGLYKYLGQLLSFLPIYSNLYIYILYFPLLRPCADSNPYPAPAYWIADQRPNQLSYSRAQLDWVSRGVLTPLFYGTGLSKFEDNSTELFNRVTVK